LTVDAKRRIRQSSEIVNIKGLIYKYLFFELDKALR